MKVHTAGPEVRIDATDGMYPSELRVIADFETFRVDRHATSYGYVLRGSADLSGPDISAKLKPGAYFAIRNGESVCADLDSLVVLITRHGYKGQFAIGQLEERGRLSYIDGCSDSMLVYPSRLGDPVFNHLHFPANVDQTQHTHPSIRIGIVVRGSGEAFGPGWKTPLVAGAVFLLEEQEIHSFRTAPGQTMDVVAYHPDSDWGPTDAAHPMKMRTYIGNQR